MKAYTYIYFSTEEPSLVIIPDHKNQWFNNQSFTTIPFYLHIFKKIEKHNKIQQSAYSHIFHNI